VSGRRKKIIPARANLLSNNW